MVGRSVENVIVGRVLKTFGRNGELVITLYDTFENEITEGPVYIDIDNMPTPLFFKSFTRRGRSKAVVIFDDMETERWASELLGREFYAVYESTQEESPLPDDDNIYLEDMVGYTITTTGEKSLLITGFIESELNPLFEIEFEGRPILVPAADELIVSINKKARTIQMDLPDGLLEL